MLSLTSLRKIAAEFRTSDQNVMREYLQHLLLFNLYQQEKSDALAFKGGTAFRILFGSPRFSEYLDFSSRLTRYHIQQILKQTLAMVAQEGIPWTAEESKTTTGGYFAKYRFGLHGHDLWIEFNISLRDKISPEPVLVTSPFIPAYQCMTLPVERLVWEKIDALIRRKKPRDFFDLYFLLRERRGIGEIVKQKKKLLPLVGSLDQRQVKEELRLFLPATQHAILKDFPTLLSNELKRL